jgi:hypothetical protein
MMKDFMLFLSHVLNLILVALFGLMSGVAIGYYNIGDIADGIYTLNAEAIDKRKKTKTEKARKMGFHLVDN